VSALKIAPNHNPLYQFTLPCPRSLPVWSPLDLSWFYYIYVIKRADEFGLADGFHIAVGEKMAPEPGGTTGAPSVMRLDGSFSCAAIDILRGREVIAREGLRNLITIQDLRGLELESGDG
jgi:hypothetical protein